MCGGSVAPACLGILVVCRGLVGALSGFAMLALSEMSSGCAEIIENSKGVLCLRKY
jgi:hypothetical protein